MTFIDKSIDLVRGAVKRIGKKPLADKADRPDGVLRNVEHDDWNPTASVLRDLEKAAEGVDPSPVVEECEGRNSLRLTGGKRA